MIKDIISTTYIQLKKSKPGSYKQVMDELELLGFEYTNDDINIAHQLVKSSDNLKAALTALAKHEKDNSISSVLSDAKTEIVAKQQEEQKVKQDKKKKQDASKAAASQKKEVLNNAQLNNPYLHISEYKVLREKNLFNLEVEVNKAIKKGWSPIGGISGIAFGMSTHGGNSFAQALAKFKY